MIHFYKYQGTGNDFVMIDARQNDPRLTQEHIAWLCHRRFGIGADGLILLKNHPDYDFQMVYYNSDGRESTMCGNGGRCIARFAFDLGFDQEELSFIAIDGPHKAKRMGAEISLQMADVNQGEQRGADFFLNTGSPHHVVFHEQPDSLAIIPAAHAIRYAAPYKQEGVNVNFVKNLEEGKLSMRTYERGVEDETYSCGTGVTAAVLAAHQAGFLQKSYAEVETKGGKLALRFQALAQGGYRDIWLEGPAQKVFEGKIALP